MGLYQREEEGVEVPRPGGHPRKPENSTESLSLFSSSSVSSSFLYTYVYSYLCVCVRGVGKSVCQNRSVEMGN